MRRVAALGVALLAAALLALGLVGGLGRVAPARAAHAPRAAEHSWRAPGPVTGTASADTAPAGRLVGPSAPAAPGAVCAQGVAGTCNPVELVLTIEPSDPPYTISPRAGALITVTTRYTSVEVPLRLGFVPPNGHFVAGTISSTQVVTVAVGAITTTQQPFTNSFQVPCECTAGAGLLQASEVHLFPSGPLFPSRGCPAGGTCQPVWLAITLPGPVSPSITSPYSGAAMLVTVRLTQTERAFSRTVPGSGQLVLAPAISSTAAVTVSVAAVGTQVAFTQTFVIPCVCEPGGGLWQVVEARLGPDERALILPHTCPTYVPYVRRDQSRLVRWRTAS